MAPAPMPWELPSLQVHLDAALSIDAMRVLDVGCGAGWLVRHLSSRGADAVGVECGQVMIERARAADPENSDRYIEGVGQALPFGDDSFDVVVFSFSLHHVPADDMDTALTEAARVLRPHGQLVVAEPVATGLGHQVDALVDDETAVREFAQQALDRIPPTLFDAAVPQALIMGSPYRDFADYESQVVGIDPDRAVVMAERRDQVQAAFHANATEHDGTWWFQDHLLIRSFTLR